MINSIKLNPLKSELDAILNLDSFLNSNKKTTKAVLSVVKNVIPNFDKKMIEIQTLFKELKRKKSNFEVVA